MTAPILVAGITPRCGTNHLLNLLCAHPDVAPPSPVWEDFLLAHAHHLDAYVEAVGGSWNPRWGVDERHADALRKALGGGLERFLADLADSRRVAAKTPSVENLERFAALFPTAKLVVLVRDGRAVVESGVRSFGWFRESAMRRFAIAAETVARFEARADGLRHRTVRYEALVEDPEATLRELFDFLELDASRYAFDKIEARPVLGSSTLVKRPGGRVHWSAETRGDDFDPLRRFEGWSRGRHARFNWVAGQALRQLGYAPVAAPRGALRNAALDVLYRAAWALRPLWRAWRNASARR